MWIVRLGSLALAAFGVWLLIALYTHAGGLIEQQPGVAVAAAFGLLIVAVIGIWVQHMLGWLYPPTKPSPRSPRQTS